MSIGMFLLILFLAVVALMVTIIKFKVHPVISIFVVALLLAIALGNNPVDAVGLINSGFGGTLSSIGIVMILGSIIAMGIQDTGAATSIANFFIKLTRGKNVELAPSLTGYILSIPVFGDITIILLAPIANLLAFRKKMSMSKMATFVQLGLNFTHALVPPTPGILAISIMLGADVGAVITYGILVTIIVFFVEWLLLRKWTEKEYIPPNPDFIVDEKTAAEDVQTNRTKDLSTGSDKAYEEAAASLIIQEKDLPAAWHAFLPLLVPVLLISLASFGKAYLPKDSTVLAILNFVGDRVISLLIGVIFAITLVMGRESKVRERILELDKNLQPTASLTELLLNGWVKRALALAIVPLLVTAMGGAFGKVLSNAPQAKELAQLISQTNILPIFVPWIIAVAMMTCVGSMTMGQMTAAGIVAPMLPQLGISPVAAVLAIGAGVLAINHVNNSGFWVLSGFYNLNPRQGLKYITVPGAIASVLCIILIAILVQLGIM